MEEKVYLRQNLKEKKNENNARTSNK